MGPAVVTKHPSHDSADHPAWPRIEGDMQKRYLGPLQELY